jgi:phosphoribosylanthranilate isomerase
MVREAVATLQLDAVQLHGDADPSPIAATGIPWVMVVRGTPALAQLRPPAPAPQWILLDARVQGYGGAGATTDWSWAAAAVRHLAPLPVWLAGGIDPKNAASALDTVGPAGLDVASGAESAPGIKDAARVAALAAICKNRSS